MRQPGPLLLSRVGLYITNLLFSAWIATHSQPYLPAGSGEGRSVCVRDSCLLQISLHLPSLLQKRDIQLLKAYMRAIRSVNPNLQNLEETIEYNEILE